MLKSNISIWKYRFIIVFPHLIQIPFVAMKLATISFYSHTNW